MGSPNTPPDLVDFVQWDGFYHEMFNELGKERVFKRVKDWLDARLGDIHRH